MWIIVGDKNEIEWSEVVHKWSSGWPASLASWWVDNLTEMIVAGRWENKNIVDVSKNKQSDSNGKQERT